MPQNIYQGTIGNLQDLSSLVFQENREGEFIVGINKKTFSKEASLKEIQDALEFMPKKDIPKALACISLYLLLGSAMHVIESPLQIEKAKQIFEIKEISFPKISRGVLRFYAKRGDVPYFVEIKEVVEAATFSLLKRTV